MLTDEEIKEARALINAATPGPWHARPAIDGRGDENNDLVVTGDYDEAKDNPDAVVVGEVWYDGPHVIVRPCDSAFIAAARVLLPATLDDLALMHGRVVGLGALVDLRGETISRLEAERDRAVGGRDEAMGEADRLRDRLAAERTEILNALKLWVAERRESETEARPDVNIYKRVLLATWNQVEAKIDELLARKQADPPLAGTIDASKDGT